VDVTDVSVSEDRLVRPAEAAERLAISKPQLYKLAAAGVVKAVKIAGSVRIPQSESLRLMTEGTAARETETR